MLPKGSRCRDDRPNTHHHHSAESPSELERVFISISDAPSRTLEKLSRDLSLRPHRLGRAVPSAPSRTHQSLMLKRSSRTALQHVQCPSERQSFIHIIISQRDDTTCNHKTSNALLLGVSGNMFRLQELQCPVLYPTLQFNRGKDDSACYRAFNSSVQQLTLTILAPRS